jgi:poly-gamma-glutamate capsule biosynthesis protein CapA/YwtB (metallophosphatase superfamily)
MKRRRFVLQGLGIALGLTLPRWVRAQGVAPVIDSVYDPTKPRADSLRGRRDSTAVGEPRVLLAAGGDTTLGYNLEAHFDQQVAAGVPKEQLWPLYFAGIKPLFAEADIALVNLECPFTERGEKLQKNFNFRARRELVRILQEGSVDVASLANNHTADYGRHGVKDTMETLDRAGIARFGAGMHQREARRPALLERRGLRVGFIGYYFQADPDMLEPEEVYATARRAGVAGCYKDLACVKRQVREDVEELRDRVDAVVPYFHWGKEGSYEVRDYQIELGHLCVDLGCKAVLGAHPHRLQGIEVYRGAPIFYSLGNFVYGGIKEPRDTLTAIARVWLSRKGVEADLVPVQFTRWPEAPFQPFVLEGPARDEALSRIAYYSRGFAETLPCLAGHAREAAPADSLRGSG